MGPVYHTPAGTTTRPPPCSARASMAAAKAPVASVWASPEAPKSATLTERAGMAGCTTAGISKGISAGREPLCAPDEQQPAARAAAAGSINRCFRFIIIR